MQDESNILELNDVQVRYEDGQEALRGVDLQLRRGSRMALLGPNGAGKSSLLLAVLGAAPSDGRICVDGLELARKTQDEIRSRCGMVFQEPDDQLFMPTLLDDVAFGPLNQALPPDQARQRALAALADVGLAGLEHRNPAHLSGGQKHAAAIATVLSMNVKLLLLDEPGSGLDCRSRRRLVQLLQSRGESMLLATHDLTLAGQLCDQVAVLDEGRVVACGPAKPILSDEGLLSEHGLM